MTKKHFEAVARALRAMRYDLRTSEEATLHERFCERIADVFAGDNSRFDRERFLDACEIPGHEKPPKGARILTTQDGRTCSCGRGDNVRIRPHKAGCSYYSEAQ